MWNLWQGCVSAASTSAWETAPFARGQKLIWERLSPLWNGFSIYSSARDELYLVSLGAEKAFDGVSVSLKFKNDCFIVAHCAFKAFSHVCPEGANISGGRCISVLVELKRQLHNTVPTFQWLSQTFHSNITNTCCSVILMPAASIYTDALACANSEEKEAQTRSGSWYLCRGWTPIMNLYVSNRRKSDLGTG